MSPEAAARPAQPDRAAAGIVSRALAAVVDAAVVLAMMGLALLAVAGLRFLASPASFRWPSPPWTLSLAVGAALAAVYLTLAWATSGRTCGAAVAGVRVRSIGGGRLGWVRAALRAALCVAFPPGLAWCAVSRRRHSLQDALLGSVVVYDGNGDARIPARPPPAVHPLRMGDAATSPGHRGRTSAEEASP